jgi:hypothetical protein
MTRKNHPNPRRSTISLIGSVALMALATGIVAAQPVEIEPPMLGSTTQVMPDPEIENDFGPTAYESMITDLRRAHEVEVSTAYESMIADLQRRATEPSATTLTAYESMAADLREAAEER